MTTNKRSKTAKHIQIQQQRHHASTSSREAQLFTFTFTFATCDVPPLMRWYAHRIVITHTHLSCSLGCSLCWLLVAPGLLLPSPRYTHSPGHFAVGSTLQRLPCFSGHPSELAAYRGLCVSCFVHALWRGVTRRRMDKPSNGQDPTNRAI